MESKWATRLLIDEQRIAYRFPCDFGIASHF